MTPRILTVVTVGVLAAFGCSERPAALVVETDLTVSDPSMASEAGTTEPAWPLREEFIPIVQSIAARYRREFTIVSPVPKWAPELCSAYAVAMVAPRPRMSASADPETHGRKLYYLYASDLAAYIAPSVSDDRLILALGDIEAEEPIGSTLVKQSWDPVRVEDVLNEQSPYRRLVKSNNEWYEAGEQRELFVMTKLDPSTPNTDAGWVYATVAPDTHEVTAVGRIASCMECHRANGERRLFGVSNEEAARIVRLSILGEQE